MNRRSGRRSSHGATAAVVAYGAQLSRRISLALLVVLGALWVTGLYWLLLHYGYAKPNEFGVTRHPLEGPVVLVHGVMALVALFLLGWFAGRHAGAAASGRRVLSGWLLTVLLAILVLAGCAQLFLTSTEWQSVTALVHELLGAALVVPVLAHGWRFSAASRAPAPAQRHARGHGHGHGHGHGPAHDPARPPRSAHN